MSCRAKGCIHHGFAVNHPSHALNVLAHVDAQTAVDAEDVSSHEGRQWAGQPHDGVADFLGLARPAEKGATDDLLLEIGRTVLEIPAATAMVAAT